MHSAWRPWMSWYLVANTTNNTHLSLSQYSFIKWREGRGCLIEGRRKLGDNLRICDISFCKFWQKSSTKKVFLLTYRPYIFYQVIFSCCICCLKWMTHFPLVVINNYIWMGQESQEIIKVREWMPHKPFLIPNVNPLDNTQFFCWCYLCIMWTAQVTVLQQAETTWQLKCG